MLSRILGKSMLIVACMYLSGVTRTQAQTNTDTLRIGIKDAEQIFIDKNLTLLAAHYNIEANKALVQQAKLWDDPVLNTDQNMYSNNKFFHHGTNPDGTTDGQVYIQVQQLIKTANKRGKLIQMAKTNTAISELQFRDVMLHLRYELRTDMYTLTQLMRIHELYVQEGAQIDKLLLAMNAQLQVGNIAKKDLMRIQALQLSMQQESTEIDKQIADNEAELKTLLQLKGSTFVLPVVAASDSAMSAPTMPLAQMVAAAKEHNTAYQLQLLQLQYQQQNLGYQKALAVPDVTVSPNFDQNSNYTPKYYGLGISLPIPILNGNRGNIKAARWQVKEQDATVKQLELELENKVASAYSKLLAVQQLSSRKQQSFYDSYQQLYNNILDSYQQRQISLIEFIDYFSAYKDIKQKQLQQQLNLHTAQEDLNLQIGTDL